MKKEKKAALWGAVAGIFGAVALWVGVAQAQVTIQYDAEGVQASQATLRFIVDGGCIVSACGTATSTDAGSVIPLCVNNVFITRPAFVAKCAAFAQASQVLLSASLGTGNDGGAP